MKVICIDSKINAPYDIRNTNSIFLTENKIYHIHSRFLRTNNKDFMISVKDDSGYLRYYNEMRFVTVEEYRDLKLKIVLE